MPGSAKSIGRSITTSSFIAVVILVDRFSKCSIKSRSQSGVLASFPSLISFALSPSRNYKSTLFNSYTSAIGRLSSDRMRPYMYPCFLYFDGFKLFNADEHPAADSPAVDSLLAVSFLRTGWGAIGSRETGCCVSLG